MSKPSEKKKLKFQCPNCKNGNLRIVDFCQQFRPVSNITSEPWEEGPYGYTGKLFFDNEIGEHEPEEDYFSDDVEYACSNCNARWRDMEAINTAGGFIPDDEDEGN